MRKPPDPTLRTTTVGVTPVGYKDSSFSLICTGLLSSNLLSSDRITTHAYGIVSVCTLFYQRRKLVLIKICLHLNKSAKTDFAPPDRLMHWNPHLGQYFIAFVSLIYSGHIESFLIFLRFTALL